MKSFFAAALATGALAMDNMTALTTVSVATSTDIVLASVESSTMWKKSGDAAADATIDIMLSLKATRAATYPATLAATWMSGNKWNFIFSETAESTMSEAHLFTTTSGGVQTQAYGTTNTNAGSWDGALVTPAPGGSWKYVLKADEPAVTQDSSAAVAPPADYWKVNVTDSRLSADVWTLELTRSQAGNSGVKVGATENKTHLAISYMTNANSKTFSGRIDFIVAAEPAANNTNDGATSVTTFGAAVVAAVAALMF